MKQLTKSELDALLRLYAEHTENASCHYERGEDDEWKNSENEAAETKAKITTLFQQQAKEASQRDKYQKAINKIDDYFEYRNESQQDKEFVHGVLSELCEGLRNP